jgi:hypothetical protein
MIVVNYGEVGPGVTQGYAGLEVDRGTLTDYRFVFDEPTDTFRVGEVGSLQAVATREDAPIAAAVPYWNDTDKRFDTANSTLFIDSTNGWVGIGAIPTVAFDVTVVATFGANIVQTAGTLQLANGTSINEFSTDITLGGDSNTAVPTEKAVKTYVDAGDAATLVSANAYTDSQIALLDIINVVTITSDSTAVTGDVVITDTTGGNVNVTLIGIADGRYTVKKSTGDVNTVTIAGDSGTIDGYASITIDTKNQAYSFVCDGTDYYIV